MNKRQFIKCVCNSLEHVLDFYLKEEEDYDEYDIQKLEEYQNMHFRGEIEIFKSFSKEDEL